MLLAQKPLVVSSYCAPVKIEHIQNTTKCYSSTCKMDSWINLVTQELLNCRAHAICLHVQASESVVLPSEIEVTEHCAKTN